MRLRYLTAGATTTVFLRCGEDGEVIEPGRVYKLPNAAIESRTGAVRRALSYAAGKVPARPIPWASLRRLPWRLVYNFTYQITGSRRRDKLINFHRMLELISFIHQHGGPELNSKLPQQEIRCVQNTRCVVGDAEHLYSGPLIIQERAVHFFDRDNDGVYGLLRDFPSKVLCDIHTELWRLGLGFRASQETWGPFNWGYKVSGNITVFDFSSLTNNRAAVSRVISDNIARRMEEDFVGFMDPESVRRHFNVCRAFMNPNILEREWEKKLRNFDSVRVAANLDIV